ncbi:MAG: hypothetical protein ACLP1D_22580 [Xanthobacteraceae bacterium]
MQFIVDARDMFQLRPQDAVPDAVWALALPVAVATALVLVEPATAGPPYVSDDPETTDYQHFEVYTFNNGLTARGALDFGTRPQAGTIGETGVDINYGAGPNLQLTTTVPAGYSSPAGGPTWVGMGNVELAAKYRFLRQDSFGLDVSVFPRVFLPGGPNSVNGDRASLLLPAWVQKDWAGGWSAFGGGGCMVGSLGTQQFCLAGAVLNYQLLPKLQLGVEYFHQTADRAGTPATSSLGLGFRYDLTETYHLLGYVRRGIENADQTDQYAWYASVLFTF